MLRPRLRREVGQIYGVLHHSPRIAALYRELFGRLRGQENLRQARRALLGSAKLFLESEAVLGEKMHPAQLKDMVCSPGGTTIEGVKALEEGGFRGVLMEAVEATIAKSKLL